MSALGDTGAVSASRDRKNRKSRRPHSEGVDARYGPMGCRQGSRPCSRKEIMAKVTSKLQVTIPKAIAGQYGIEPGDEIEFQPAGDAIRVVPPGRRGGARLSLEERLRLFDQAMDRQREREKTDEAAGQARWELPRRARLETRGSLHPWRVSLTPTSSSTASILAFRRSSASLASFSTAGSQPARWPSLIRSSSNSSPPSAAPGGISTALHCSPWSKPTGRRRNSCFSFRSSIPTRRCSRPPCGVRPPALLVRCTPVGVRRSQRPAGAPLRGLHARPPLWFRKGEQPLSSGCRRHPRATGDVRGVGC